MFYFYAKRGGLTPQQRAENVSHEITTLGKRFNLHPDSVYIESTDIVTDVMYGDKVIVSFTDQDGLWESCTRDQLAAAKRTVIVEKLKVMKEEHGLLQLFKRIAYFVLVLVGQFLLFKLTNWLFRKLKVRILRLRNTRLKAFSIQDFELLDTQKQVRLLVFVANLFRYAFMMLQLLLTVPMLFAIFPQTKNLAYQLFFYIWDPVKSILYGILAYIPNLFTIFVICLAIKYLVRLFRYLAGEVQSERLKLNGFYPDWAMPTYHIIRFLLYAFMVAMIYPYLPGPLQRRGRGNHVAPLYGHVRRQRPCHAEGRLERKAEGKVNRDVLRDLGRPGYRDFLPVRRLGQPETREFCPVRRLGRPETREFCPVRRLGRPETREFCPVRRLGRPKLGSFTPSDVSEGPKLGSFALSDISEGSKLGSFALWGKGYLLRFTVCNTRPVLSIMRSSSVRGVAEMMEKPGSGLQYTVPSMALTLRLSEPLELVT